MDMIILDGAMMTDKKEAHGYLADMLRLPAYYGANLDALADCLSELNEQTCIILKNKDKLKENLGDYADMLLSMLHELSEEPYSFVLLVEGDDY